VSETHKWDIWSEIDIHELILKEVLCDENRHWTVD